MLTRIRHDRRHRLRARLVLSWLVLFGIALQPLALPPAAAGLPAPSVYLDGRRLTFDVQPFIDSASGRILVPMRAVFESLGARVVWNAADQSIVATCGERTVRLRIGSTLLQVIVGGAARTETLDVAPRIAGDRTMVPLRAISQALDRKVSWDDIERQASIAATPENVALATMVDLSGIHGQLATQRQSESKTVSGPARTGTMLVLVNADTYPNIRPALETYTQDLYDEGYSTEVYACKGGDAVDLKSFIRELWLGLRPVWRGGLVSSWALKYGTGVVLIGEFAPSLVHQRTGAPDGTVYEGTFACDLYLTDLDGSWDAVDGQGVPFISTVDPTVIAPDSECRPEDMDCAEFQTTQTPQSQGGARPEIFLGRLSPGQLCHKPDGAVDLIKEAAYLNSYFERNHLYRHRQFPIVPTGKTGADVAARSAVLLYDHDWFEMAPESAEALTYSFSDDLHSNQATLIGQPHNIYFNQGSTTDPSYYKKVLTTSGILWFESLIHSNLNLHEFGYHYVDKNGNGQWADEGLVTASMLKEMALKPLFYNLQGCDTSDYRQPNNLGTTCLFSGDTLAVIGNTTVGGHDTAEMHLSLGKGFTLGQSFMINQRAYMHYPGWTTNREFAAKEAQSKRYYSLVLLGDPTLTPVDFIPQRVPARLIPPQDAMAIAISLDEAVKVESDIPALNEATAARERAEQPGLFRRIPDFPVRGIDPTAVDPGQPVFDPLFFGTQMLPQMAYQLTLLPETKSLSPGQPVTFSGRLTGSRGTTGPRGVAGKTIGLLAIDMVTGVRTPIGQATTQDDGTYTLTLERAVGGLYEAVFAEQGRTVVTSNHSLITVVAPVTCKLTLVADRTTVLPPNGATVFSGTLTQLQSSQSPTGAPLSGMTVRLYRVSVAPGTVPTTVRTPIGSATTSSDGSYLITVAVTPGVYQAIYSDDGGFEWPSNTISLQAVILIPR